MAEDPIGLAGGDVSFYRYVSNDPVNLVDPWGLFGIDDLRQPPVYGPQPPPDGTYHPYSGPPPSYPPSNPTPIIGGPIPPSTDMDDYYQKVIEGQAKRLADGFQDIYNFPIIGFPTASPTKWDIPGLLIQGFQLYGEYFPYNKPCDE